MTDWLSVIAIAGFVVAVGQFLDKYHISSKFKDYVRSLLVRAFIALDSVSIPDVPRRVLIELLQPSLLKFRRVCVLLLVNFAITEIVFRGGKIWQVTLYVIGVCGLAAVSLGLTKIPLPQIDSFAQLFGAMAIVALLPIPVFLFERFVLIRKYDSGLSIVLHLGALWIIASTVVAMIFMPYFIALAKESEPEIILPVFWSITVTVPVAIFIVMRWIFALFYDSQVRIVKVASPLLTGLLTLLIILIVALGFLSRSQDFGQDIVYGMFIGSALVAITIITLLVVVVVIVRLILELAKKAGLLIFDAASSPEASPFSYATALLGLAILAAKLILKASDVAGGE